MKSVSRVAYVILFCLAGAFSHADLEQTSDVLDSAGGRWSGGDDNRRLWG